ncbi:Stk1 family PASTA domain-containing Ser/Thr kinase [Lactiplantibacillus garii]|uniref:non-specific serine/threonine protein kinase n=1 Tax=Lactiplantibacillus garii TaxID=2306423 RepID=A0A426D8W2_9LACO|nr:Stk1 family PASTA domain-containing Ser/Thr kinase [Lactiplantibacillus garii]RRK11042.1 Stk1 family PASTA domain-containing Ser/Thr kinase [Lactiplantibacillus garii]
MTPNYTLSGRYRIVRSLGEGGMANVYLAHDLILDRDVAVKLLRLDLRDDPKTIKRFQREALATTELVHPHIVSLYDIGEENGMQYLVMEYVKGMDLKNYIKENFPIPLQQVIDIMEQILSAVATAHAHNIIHRDLKPQNILIDEQGNAKITDFGIAVALSEHSMTQTNTILGSVHYLSPEQARGSMATKQSDIYSLGIILYEMLTGSVPFKGETAVSIALKHFQNAIPSVRDFDADIPQALENVVLCATAKDPRDRYATVEDMASDLLTTLSSTRVGEKRFVPDDVGNDETKIMPSAEIQAAIKANQDGKTQVMPRKTAAEADQVQPKPAPAQPKEPAEEPVRPTRSWSKRHPLRRRLLIIGTIILLLVAAIVIGLELSRPQSTTVPRVTGLSQAAATKVLAKRNLSVGEVKRVKSNQVATGQVVKTTPGTKTKVSEHARINLTISSGAKKMNFGNYVNESYRDVRQTLKSAGFTVRERFSTSDVATGQIISQDVAAGSSVLPTTTTVTFTVSAGSRYVALKDLTGESQADITDYAQSNGLNVNFKRGYSSEQKAGYSYDQTPDGGADVRAGSTITVTMSRGSQPETAATPTNFYVKLTLPYKALTPTTTQANDVKIYLQDDNHVLGTLYRDLAIMHDTRISLPFELTGKTKGRYRIVRNGVTISEKFNVTSQDATN